VPSLYYVPVHFKYGRDCLIFLYSAGLYVTEGQSLLACFKKDTIYFATVTTKDKVFLKITVFWDVILYSLVDRYQHFEATCFLHLQVTL
jgi:hypothetical protein